MNYFIADLHLGHKNCLRFDNRPFKTIEEQDNYVIENWNKKITVNDDVYILGDFSWYDDNKTIDIFSNLNGKLHLIKGNHDSKLLKNKNIRNLFVEICDYKELYLTKNTSIVLSHYPIPCYKNHHRGWYHLYGHVHNGMEYQIMQSVARDIKSFFPDKDYHFYNVGAMMSNIDYIPRTIDEIMK